MTRTTCMEVGGMSAGTSRSSTTSVNLISLRIPRCSCASVTSWLSRWSANVEPPAPLLSPRPPPGQTPVLTVQTTRTHDPHVRRSTTCTAKPLPNGLRIEVPHPLERVSLHDAQCLLGASGKAGDLSYDVVGPGMADEPPRPFSAVGQLRRVHEQDR